MEEENASMVLSDDANLIEISNSNSSNNVRHSQFKAVVPHRSGSYGFSRSHHRSPGPEIDKRISTRCGRKYSCTQLFEKQLTASDVGKLNRLVIPKKFATRFFPTIPGTNRANGDGIQLGFYDWSMARWVFRYCYWNSSQSYVFTRGWNRFVREMRLQPNDRLDFFLCERRDNEVLTQTFFMIDTSRHGSAATRKNTLEAKLQRRLDRESDNVTNVETVGPKPAIQPEKKGFKLFGTSIML